MAQTDFHGYPPQGIDYADYYYYDEDPGMAHVYAGKHPGAYNGGYEMDYHPVGSRGKVPHMNGTSANYPVHDVPGLHDSMRLVSVFQVEHLASFPQDGRTGFVSPVEALNRLKRISASGGIWAQVMSMKVTDEYVAMANGETMEPIEEYPLEQISVCTHILNDDVFENLLIFTTKLSRDKVGAIHIFQCRSGEAPVISADINRRTQGEETVNGYSDPPPSWQPEPPVQREPVTKPVSKVPEPRYRQEVKPEPTREIYTTHQTSIDQVPVPTNEPRRVPEPTSPTRHYTRGPTEHPTGGVITAVKDLEKRGDGNPIVPGRPIDRNPSLKGAADYPDSRSPLEDARINRDVEVLNHCIEEIENFVIILKRANDARKLLTGKKKKRGRKYEMLKLQAEPPSTSKIIDIYQKFKYSFNLLGRLRPHISSPNSPELVHYLMVPLHIITKVTGTEKVRTVINPLLTVAAVDLLGNCLASKEYEFWQSLGPNWVHTKSSPEFRDKYVPPYQPTFNDGWIPPEIVANEREDSAARSAAAQIARMKDEGLSRFGYDGYPALARSTSKEEHAKSIVSSDDGKSRKVSNDVTDGLQRRSSSKQYDDLQFRQSPPKTQQDSGNKSLKQVRVMYDYNAHNSKELTIRPGEKLYVLDDSRRWWLVKNAHNEQGYVPSTVLEFPPEADSSDSSSFDGSSPPSPPSTGYNTAVVETVKINNNNNMSVSHNTNVIHSTNVSHSTNVNNNMNINNNNALYTKPQKSFSLEQKDEAVQTANWEPVTKYQGQPTYKSQETHYKAQETHYKAQETVVSAQLVERQRSTQSVTNIVIPSPPPPPPEQFSSVIPPPPAPPPPPELPKIVASPVVPKLMSPAPPKTAPKPGSENLQSELRNRLNTPTTLSPPAYPTSVDVDGVDVFIPLYKSSTADDVSRWLRKLKFSEDTLRELHGITAKELFKIQRDDLIERLGEYEGTRLFEELLVQTGAHTKHKTMTEFQKVLIERMKKREDTEKHIQPAIPPTSPGAPLTQKPRPPVAPKRVEELQKKYEEQQALIRKQQEELERLKGREPEKPTFSSFNGTSSFNFTSQSVHGKTKF